MTRGRRVPSEALQRYTNIVAARATASARCCGWPWRLRRRCVSRKGRCATARRRRSPAWGRAAGAVCRCRPAMGGSASSAWWRTCTKARPPRPVAGRRVAFVGPPVLERGVLAREDPRRRRSHRRRRARSLPFEGLRLRMLDTHAVVRSLTDAEIHAGPGGHHHDRGPSGRRARRPCPARSVHGQPRRGGGRNRRGADGDRRVAEAPVPVPSTDALPGPRSRRSARLRLLELAHRKPGGGGLTGCPRSSGTVATDTPLPRRLPQALTRPRHAAVSKTGPDGMRVRIAVIWW